jgi:hypothetical protein
MSDPVLPADDDALKKLLRKLAPQSPANPAIDNGPWDFLVRQENAAIATRVRPVLHELAADSDATVRLRAIEVLTNLPEDPGTLGRLIEVAQKRPELFRDARVAQSMQHALANVAMSSGREREIVGVIRTLAGSQLPADAAASVVGVHEPDWTIELARRYAASGRANAFCSSVASMFAGYHRDRLLELLTAMRGLDADAKTQVLASLNTFLVLPDETARTLATHAGVAPPSTKPTLDECRRALG